MFGLPRDLTGSITRDSGAPVGSGSFSDVYLGTYLTSNGSIKVAIKVVRLSYGNPAIKTRQRLQRELRVWSMFEHPNVLALLGTTIGFGGLLGIVSPWAENGTLTSYLARQSHLLTDAEVLLMIADVASGLHYLHSQSVVHGNLSGGNVLIDASGRALLADFGTSAIYGELVQSVSTPSGTLRWMAPEALILNESDDSSAFPTRQSDVYSFGGIMLQILSGKIPYHYLQSEHQAVLAVVKGIIPLRPNDARVTDRRWMFIHRCWSSPETRPLSEEIVLFSKNEIAEYSPPQV